MKVKSIKDAIHGYIRLEELFWKIIDTAEFQRLKWIEQTSYRVLYPSARHDRFIHSIGVYHLGQKAIQGFLNNCDDKDAEIVKKYKYSFLLACLLHDIGHAPFSHTCENLFSYKEKINNKNSKINKELLAEIKSHLDDPAYHVFEKDYFSLIMKNPPAPHEIMSSIITCRKFGDYNKFFESENINSLNLDLIVRSIIGCCYSYKRTDDEDKRLELGIKNCLIRLLNSSTVDVDKLDYIARDTQMSGYDSIVLDNKRLLDNVCIVDNDGIYYPAFGKGALSVLNNVVIAKNSQAKWIINHPVVIYEAYLLCKAIGISLANSGLRNTDNVVLSSDEIINFIFSSASLSKEGHQYFGGKFRLLSDVEILNLMKSHMEYSVVSEYFSRDERKSPVWKSSEEFLYCLDSNEDKAAEVAEYMAPLINFFNNVDDITDLRQIDSKILLDDSLNERQDKETVQNLINVLLEYHPDTSYVILPAKNTFYARIDADKLYIRFGNVSQNYTTYKKLEGEDKGALDKRYSFFYLYSSKKIDPKKFLEYLYDKAHSNIIYVP